MLDIIVRAGRNEISVRNSCMRRKLRERSKVDCIVISRQGCSASTHAQWRC